MKRTVFMASLILFCLLAGGCLGIQPTDKGVGENSKVTQNADTEKGNPDIAQSPSTAPVSSARTDKVTEANAIERVSRIVGTLQKGWYLEVDHSGTVDGRSYYIVHFYEEVIDDEKEKVGHTVTYGWYYVDMDNGDVFEMDIATGKLMKPSLKPSDSPKEQISYKTYKNERFQFSVEYPGTFITKMLPENGDGIKLGAQDGSANLIVSGINNVLDETAPQLLANLVREHNPSYKIIKENWFVASWAEGDRIVYEKCIVGSGSINTFVIEYPVNQKEIYDPVVEHLNASFKTPSINESH